MADPKGLLVVPIGYRADGSLHALELDDSDRLKVLIDSVTGTLIVNGPSPSVLNPTGINTRYENLNLPAGASVQTIFTVPANQTYQLTTFVQRYTGTVAGVSVTARIEDGATILQFFQQSPPVSGVFYTIVCDILLSAGNVLSCGLGGVTLNDDYLALAFCKRIK